MGIATIIPADTFEQIQVNAGCLLWEFDPNNPKIESENVICPTTGGVTVNCVPSRMNLGEDVDNCPNNLLELMKTIGYDCSIEFVSLGTSLKSIALALGAADIDESAGSVTPRLDIKVSDAKDIWWAGDRADGGLLAVVLKRAISTSGVSLKTTKDGKGQTSTALTGHTTVATQNEVPMTFYSISPEKVTLEE